ncbi:MAG: OmpA family protein [Deltaproteobacteria bacterium]|nr:OmpA family protein [Deltaproteobacteria bacterium]
MVRCLSLIGLIFGLLAAGCANMESGNGETGTAERGFVRALAGIRGGAAEKSHASSPSGPTSGSVSQYMDRQEKEFHQRLALVEGTSVQRVENNLAVTFESDLFFDAESFEIKEDGVVELDYIAALLCKYPQTAIEIGGYTDSTGSESHNLQLSQQRAEAVAKVLQAKGVDAGRISTRGFGESGPVASNATEAGRQKNRRITLFIIPRST